MKDIITFLTEREIKANKIDTSYRNVIFDFIKNNKNSDLYQYLIKNNNLDLNFYDSDGNSPILLSKFNNFSVGLISLMLDMNSNINDVCHTNNFFNGDNLLFLFTKEDKDNLVLFDTLIKNGININLKNAIGDTPLMHYLKESKPLLSYINKLLDAKCDVNIKDKNGISALYYADKLGNSEIYDKIKKGSK